MEGETGRRSTGRRSLRVYLTGFMAAGKTVVGSELARFLGCAFCDLDEAIEDEAGETVREIFSRHGEAAFRELEHVSLRRTAELGDAVVATGGGTMAFGRNREIIARLCVRLWVV